MDGWMDNWSTNNTTDLPTTQLADGRTDGRTDRRHGESSLLPFHLRGSGESKQLESFTKAFFIPQHTTQQLWYTYK